MGNYTYRFNPISGEFDIVQDLSLIHIKDPVDTYNDLPITANAENDARFVKDTDILYVWSIADQEGILSDWKETAKMSIADLDALDDGSIYGRVKNTELEEGQVKRLDDGTNEVTAEDAKDAVDKKHTQNTDTILQKGEASDVLDQQQLLSDTDDYISTNPKGQTFKAGLSGSLSKVVLELKYFSGIGDVVIEIQGVSLGLPDGNVLATQTLLQADLPILSSEEVDIVFSSPVSVVSGNDYAIVIYSTASLSCLTRKWVLNSVYADGTLCIYSPIMESWEAVLIMDLYFKTYVQAGEVLLVDLINNGELKEDLSVAIGKKIGGNLIEDITDTVTKKHSQNTDTILQGQVYPEYFSNLDFENWTLLVPDNWNVFGNGMVEEENIKVKHGSKSIKFITTGMGMLSISQNSSPQENVNGKTIYLRGWVYANTGNFSSLHIITVPVGGGLYINDISVDNGEIVNEWVYLNVEFTPDYDCNFYIQASTINVSPLPMDSWFDSLESSYGEVLDLINDGTLKEDLAVDPGIKIGTKTIEDITDAVDKKHTQDTDTILQKGEASDVLDQQQLLSDTDILVSLSPSKGQTFKAGLSGSLSKVVLKLKYWQGIGDAVIEIQGVSLGLPDGNVLATKTILQADLPILSSEEVDIVFSSPASVVSGNDYAIVMSSTGTMSYWTRKWAINSVYADGTLCVYNPLFWAWEVEPLQDLYFKTYVLTGGGLDLINNGILKEDLEVDTLITIDGRDVSVDGTKLDGIEALSVSLPTVKADADIADAITHKDLTNNPHTVTSAQVGAYTQAETNTLVDKAKCIEITLSGNANNYLFSKSASYTVLTRFIFKGTTILGNPTNIKMIVHVKTALKPGDVRIYDLTNANVICEVTGISSLIPIVVDLGTLSNLPSGEVMFEVQVKCPLADEVYVSGLIIEF